eukprot:5838982-Pleurochrysis_carterae.AAC.1
MNLPSGSGYSWLTIAPKPLYDLELPNFGMRHEKCCQQALLCLTCSAAMLETSSLRSLVLELHSQLQGRKRDATTRKLVSSRVKPGCNDASSRMTMKKAK